MRLSLRILVFSTLGISLAASLLPALQDTLALSRSGVAHFYLWKLFSYPFVEALPFSLGFFIELAFNMYILWLFGSSLLERFEPKKFFTLYFGAAVTGAIAAIAASPLKLAGSSGPVYAVMTAWMMANPGAQLKLFFSLPFKATWLILGLIIASVSLDLLARDWVEAANLIGCVIFSYFFALAAWKQNGPFPFLHSFENKLSRLKAKKRSGNIFSPKIYDIHSGDPILNDEQFMDAMLEKISRQGENSLTEAEKKRMEQISKKKRK